MIKNMGSTDKYIRLAVAALIAALYFGKVINGTTAMVLGVLGIIFVLSSMINFCPLYLPFGISTIRKR
jgi:hypothetical protein